MRHVHYDLGTLRAGTAVRFDLAGSEANTIVVDDLNYQRYKAGQRFEYVGVHATRSPVHLNVPRTGRWHAVVDLGGRAGRVDASVSVIGDRS